MVRILVSKKLKLGVVGLVHDHVWGLLQQFREISVVEIKAVADPNQELIDRVIDMFGIKEKYHNYGEMLAKAELDAILLCNENARHADVVEIAAEKGIHVMMEKPMAATLAQADRILRAENNYGIKVMVNYPTAWNPAIRHAHKLVNEGKIGNIFHIRYRGAHAGPKEVGCSPYFYDWLYNIELNGGGALMDYCCYGVNLSLWFLNKRPSRVMAYAANLARKYIDVEDNAVVLMDFVDAVGIAEGCWSQIGPYPDSGPVINGSEGSIMITGDKKIHLFTLKRKNDYKDINYTIIDPDPLPLGMRTGPEYLVNKILNDEKIDPPLNAKFNRDVQEVLEAAIRATRKSSYVSLPLGD
jgi:predicted dehydrogenase